MTLFRPRINIVILAAGSATRFGNCKQLALYRQRPLVAWASGAAARCGDYPVTLVVPETGYAIVNATGNDCDFVIVNENAVDGIGESIALATRALRRTSDAILFTLADQPLITTAHLNELIAAWNNAGNAIVATAYAGTAGPPVLFPRDAFDALSQLTGDAGAKSLFDDAAFDVTTIPFAAAAQDVDTPDDLAALPRC